MRLYTALVLVVTGCFALPQNQDPAIKGLFTTVRPQVLITIKEHPTTADLLEISMVEPNYPPDLLRRQIEGLGRLLNSAPRGLSIFAVELEEGNPNLRFLKATFAIDGIIDRANGRLNLTHLVQAFAGAPEPHTVKGMAVVFQDEVPSKTTISRFASEAVEVEARVETQPPMIEYRVKLKSQNPGEIEVAPSKPAVEPQEQKKKAAELPSFLIWTLVGLSGLAAGGLVYSIISRKQFLKQNETV